LSKTTPRADSRPYAATHSLRDRWRLIRSGHYTLVVVLKLADRVLLLLRRAPKNADDLAAEQEAKRVWDMHAFHKSTGELTAVPKTDPRNW
jgi:hypothetical protein